MTERDAKRVVLFLCVGNSGRSVLAEALFNASAPPGWIARSGGTRPAAASDPRTDQLLEEVGIPPPHHVPRSVEFDEVRGADLRISMGCLDDVSCPANLKALPMFDWNLPDPKALDLDGFRRVRDDVRERVRQLIESLESGRLPTPIGPP